jgi:hypothetical protein
MRIEQVAEPDQPTEYRLSDGDRAIGYIREDTVGFRGFDSQAEAAEAAFTAHRALAQRRSKAVWVPNAPEEFLVWDHQDGQYVIARSGLLARLTSPDDGTEPGGWGFEVSLRPEERVSVFAMSRARTMWQALRWTGLSRGMSQFREGPTATGALSTEHFALAM